MPCSSQIFKISNLCPYHFIICILLLNFYIMKQSPQIICNRFWCNSKNTDHKSIQVFTFNPPQIISQYRFQSLSFMSREWYALIITLSFCYGRPFCNNKLITTKNLLQKNVMNFEQIIYTDIAILVI